MGEQLTTPIRCHSALDVELVSRMGEDKDILNAARVSTVGFARDETSDNPYGLINYLMKNRHGSPFEHGAMTFRVRVPIFVWREFMRHRVGFSYNEESGRYKKLEPEFYIPSRGRKLVQTGKTGEYKFERGSSEQTDLMITTHVQSSVEAWNGYQKMLDAGIAKEVARMSLPLNIYSSAYVTCNPRSLMSFLSLRTEREDATFVSHPMWEIQVVANQMEEYFASLYPHTWEAFNKNGRVSP